MKKLGMVVWVIGLLGAAILPCKAGGGLINEACSDDDGPFIGVFDPEDLTYRHVYFLASSAPTGKIALRFGTSQISPHGKHVTDPSLTVLASYNYPHGRFGTASLEVSLFRASGCNPAQTIGKPTLVPLPNTSAVRFQLSGADAPSDCAATYSAIVKLRIDPSQKWLALSPTSNGTCFAYRVCCADSCDDIPLSLCTTRTHCIQNNHRVREGAVCQEATDICCSIDAAGPSEVKAAGTDSITLILYMVFALLGVVILGIASAVAQHKSDSRNTDSVAMHTL